MRRSLPARLAAGLALAAVTAVWVIGGMQRVEIGSEIDSLLPSDEPAVGAINSLAEDFGGDPIVVLLESEGPEGFLAPESLPALLELEGALAGLPDVAVAYGPATTLNQSVTRIQQMMATLSGTRDALAESGKEQRLAQFEKRYGKLVVEGMPAGLPTLRNDKFVQTVVFDAQGQPKPQWTQYVPRRTAAAIYLRPREGLGLEAAAELEDSIHNIVDQSELTGPGDRATVSGSPMVTAGLASELRHEVPRLGAAALGAVAVVLMLVPWTRRRRRRLLPLVPMLLATMITIAAFGWLDRPLSIGAATLLPVLLGLGSYYPVYLTQRRHLRLVLSVAGAASLAFLVLAESPLPFVRDLGLAIPGGICLAVAITMFGTWLWGDAAQQSSASVPAVSTNAGSSGKTIPVAQHTTVRWGSRVLVGALVVLSAVGWGLLSDIEIRSNPQELVEGLPALDEAMHVEEQLGYSAEVDVVISGEDVLTPEGLDWLRQTQQAIVVEYGDRIQPVASAAEVFRFLGADPTQSQIDAGADLVPSYIRGAVVTPDRSRAMISLGAQWDELTGDRTILEGIEGTLPPTPPGLEADVVGTPVAAERGYDLVSDSRYRANILGIAVAGAFLWLALRRRSDAFLAMLAAAIATGLTMLAAWVSGVGLNPLTLALGSLTAAIGCEFTVLLASARRTGDTALARSVLMAAALSVAGYAALMLSSLPILQEFGVALMLSVAVSLGAALSVVRLVPGTVPAAEDQQPPSDPQVEPTRDLVKAGDMK